MEFTNISTPLGIGTKIAPARVMMPPMAMGRAADGKINEAVCEHYAQRAVNPHVGLIMTEHCHISCQGIAHDKQIQSPGTAMWNT